MSNVKSLDALDINGLAIFKENIVKKYVTNGEAPTVISRAIYKALQQYKKDVVKFYSSYTNLPKDGNSGTLYLIHKSMDSEHTGSNARYKNKIWISAPTTVKKIVCEFSSNYTVEAPKNTEGYYVLDLAEVDASRVSYFRVYKASRVLTTNLYVPGTRTILSTYTQLSDLSGKIVAVNVNGWSDTLVLPRFEYAKDLPARYTVPDDEIWIYRDSTTLSYTVNNWGSDTITEKNEYGFFVLKKGRDFPTDGNVSVYSVYIAGSTNLYYCSREDGVRSLNTANDMFRMCGHIFALPPYSNFYPAFAIYPYDYRETISSEIVETVEIPDDEIWVYAEGYNYIEVETHPYNRSVIDVPNDYGCFVLKKGVHFSSSPYTSLHTVPLIAIHFGKIVTVNGEVLDIRDKNEGMLYALCGHRVVPIDISDWDNNQLKVEDIEQATRITYTYIDPVLEFPEDTSDNKFVTYTWENNKYIQLSSAIFDTSDLHLEDITDQVLSLTSTNPISNQAFCNALRYKVSIAEILANPAMGYDNPVASSGIKAAIDRLITWEDIDCIPITENEIHTLFTTYDPIALDQANYYRIVIRGLKSEGANYLAKIFDAETLAGLTLVERSPDGPSISETLIFTEDDTGKRISVTVSCANKYNSATMFYPGDLFDANTDGYYRADTSENDLVLTIDIRRRLAMSTLRKLTFRCLAGRPYQTTVPPAEKLYISTYGSVGGIDYPSFRTNVVYTPNKVANDGIYMIPLFPAE